MIYGYIRVSTDKQTVENQRFEIEDFCSRQGIKVDSWIKETISGTVEPDRRELGSLLSRVRKDDLIICSELSRLGRSLFMIMSILNLIMEKGARVWTIKDNYRLGDDIQSKVLAFAFGLSAEIERNLISQRTKEALERKKSEGIKLGRPKGIPSQHSKLDGAELAVSIMLLAGTSINQMAKLYGTHRNTVERFIFMKRLDSRENLKKVRDLNKGGESLPLRLI
ncbi:MAG: master DNA invertase Mpi family serine-type recombinase [Treponema sp.]|nr:master DNA invertase Mpi family serine-type recombinase [Treponema sp.]